MEARRTRCITTTIFRVGLLFVLRVVRRRVEKIPHDTIMHVALLGIPQYRHTAVFRDVRAYVVRTQLLRSAISRSEARHCADRKSPETIH